MYTIHDVAKRAGVSTGTVSNVLNNSSKVRPETAKKVKKAVRELNYVPNPLAKSLKTSSSRVIGIIAEDVSFFAASKIIGAICEYCESHNYSVNLCTLNAHQKLKGVVHVNYAEFQQSEPFQHALQNSIATLLASRVCGLIYIGIHPRDVSSILPPLSIPVVYTYVYTKNDDFCINYDDYQGARLAMDHLISKGHSCIGLISGPIDSIPSHKRMRGYQNALLDNNIPFRPELVKIGYWHYEDGYNCCRELLDAQPRPTAIFCMSDLMAAGAMMLLKERRLSVPDDIALHGFDNTELSEFFIPAFTTIDLPLTEIGTQAARTLDEILIGSPPGKRGVLIPCRHITRAST